jgi:hypothetical protein
MSGTQSTSTGVNQEDGITRGSRQGTLSILDGNNRTESKTFKKYGNDGSKREALHIPLDFETTLKALLKTLPLHLTCRGAGRRSRRRGRGLSGWRRRGGRRLQLGHGL